MTTEGAVPVGSRGVTLIETLVACFLMLMVMSAVYAALLLVQRSWAVASGRTDASVNCEVALERMRRELQETTAASVSVSADLPAVGFATARDDGGAFQTGDAGSPNWQALLVYYVSAAQGVMRRRRVDTAPLPALTTTALDALCDGSGDIVAYDVTGLTASLSSGRVSVAVTCTATGLGRSDCMALSAQFALRN